MCLCYDPVVKAVAIATPHRVLEEWKPIMRRIYDIISEVKPANQRHAIQRVYEALNGCPKDGGSESTIDLSTLECWSTEARAAATSYNISPHNIAPSKLPSSLAEQKQNSTGKPATTSGYSNTVTIHIDPSRIADTELMNDPNSPPYPLMEQFSLTIPRFLHPCEVTGASLAWLVQRFGTSVSTIHTCVVRRKRVLFLGAQQPASLVCHATLSACLLAARPEYINALCEAIQHTSTELSSTASTSSSTSSRFTCPINGYTFGDDVLARCFPYASLTDMSFLKHDDGYIAGVTNPLFETRYVRLCI